MGVGVQFFAKKQKYYQNNDTSFDFFLRIISGILTI